MRIFTALCILALLLLQGRISQTKADDSDDDFFRVRDRNPPDSKRSAVVNPKKSPLPIGPTVNTVPWNETTFAYFGGWGQLISTDVHHFYIDTETLSLNLREADRKKPVLLQLQQRSSHGVHVELFMSNGEYPTPGKHKFSSNTKDSKLVTVKLPPLSHSAHWLIRVQPSEPISVWSKSVEYSLRLQEFGRTETDTFSESWEGAVATFVVVLGCTVFGVLYLRRAKDQERAQEVENEKRKSGVFRNLNTDQELLSLSEAQLKAKEGKLDRHDSVLMAGKAVSQNDFDHLLAAVVRNASPEPHDSTPTSTMNSSSSSGPPPTPPKNVTRPAVFTRTPIQTQNLSDDLANAATSSDAPSTATSATTSAAQAAAPVPSPASTTASSSAASTSASTRPAASNAPPATTAPKPAVTKTASGKPSSNVSKMTAFWANPNK